MAALVTFNLDTGHLVAWADGSRESFTSAIYLHYQIVQFPFIVFCLNAIASVVCSIIYVLVLVKIRKIRRLVRQQSDNEGRLGSLQIRMFIIVFLSIFCWWPPCVIFWYAYLTDDTLRNGRLDPLLVEFGFVLMAVSSAINPMIYTLSWKLFQQIVKCVSSVCGRFKIFCCRRWRKKEGWDRITTLSDNVYTEETSAFDSNYRPFEEVT
jgi:hypothetical protein